MNDAEGIFFQTALKIGFDELGWLAIQAEERMRHWRLGRCIRTGLVTGITRRHRLGRNWQVHDTDDDGTVTIRSGGQTELKGRRNLQNLDPAVAIDAEGYLLVHEVDAELVIPDDGTWYTLVAYRELDGYEDGTTSVTTGTKTVVGVNTKFTQLSGFTSFIENGVSVAGYDRGSNFEILSADSANGNEGIYEVDIVTDDTNMTLRDTIGGTNESALPWRIAGGFRGTPPSDRQSRQRWRAKFKLVARTREPGTESGSGATQLILADVKHDSIASPNVFIIDRRGANLLAMQEGVGRRSASDIVPAFSYGPVVTGTPAVAVLQYTEIMELTNGHAEIDHALTVTDGFLTAAIDKTTTQLYSSQQFILNPVSPNSKVLINSAADYVALIQTPENVGYGHVCFYTNGGIVSMRTTDDEGATWSGATVIWNPTSIDALDQISDIAACLLMNHRIILVGVHYDDSATFKYSVRYIYSDDYGATWSTNGEAGTNMLAGDTLNGTEPTGIDLNQSPDGIVWVAGTTIDGPVFMFPSNDDTGTDWKDITVFNDPVDLILSSKSTLDNVYRPHIHFDQDGTLILTYQGFEDTGMADESAIWVETYGYDDTVDDIGGSLLVCMSSRRLYVLDTSSGQSAVNYGAGYLMFQGGQFLVSYSATGGEVTGLNAMVVRTAIPALPVNIHNNP